MRALLAIVASVSGLQGFVHKGPTMPVCRVGVPCTAPAEVTLLFTRAAPDTGSSTRGRTVRARSDATGHYRVLLAPGVYTVSTLQRIGIGRGLRPARIHVRAGHVARLDFSIDTGIR